MIKLWQQIVDRLSYGWIAVICAACSAADCINTQYFFAIDQSNHLAEANIFVKALYPVFGVFSPIAFWPGEFSLIFGSIVVSAKVFQWFFRTFSPHDLNSIRETPAAVGLAWGLSPLFGVLSWYGPNVFQIIASFRPF